MSETNDKVLCDTCNKMKHISNVEKNEFTPFIDDPNFPKHMCHDCHIGLMDDLIADQEKHRDFEGAHKRWVELQKYKKEHGYPYDAEGMNKPFVQPTPDEIEARFAPNVELDKLIADAMKDDGVK